MTDAKAYENRRITEFNKWIEGEIDLNRGTEYAAYIFNAVFGDNEMFEFNGNVRNFGLIDNLPEGCCVEVPVLASKGRLRPLHVGPLPPQLAILNQIKRFAKNWPWKGPLKGIRKDLSCLLV